MNYIQAIILGLVQGLTEFIPVSSTGHLILFRRFLGLPLTGSLSFDAILQLATGFAILIYFWRDIWNIIKNKNFKLISTLIIATIPAVILGSLFQDYMDSTLRGINVVALALIAGAILFYFAERFIKRNDVILSQDNTNHIYLKTVHQTSLDIVSYKQGFWVGVFQCLALIPGMSRSGSTISGGLFLGLNRELATRFSFLLSLPIIFGTGFKKLFDVLQGGTLQVLDNSLLIASLFAFISGFIAIHFLLGFLKKHSLNYFGIYRIILAIIILTLF